MILVDTSVWIDHFRAALPDLVALLNKDRVLAHPCVIGEIALGTIRNRVQVLRYLNSLPVAQIAAHHEVMAFVEARRLANTGIGYVDACLLASVALTPGASLWSHDRNVMTQAARCGLGAAM